MNESSISIFIVQAALASMPTFFVAALLCAECHLYLYCVQARLAKTMVEEGVITEADRLPAPAEKADRRRGHFGNLGWRVGGRGRPDRTLWVLFSCGIAAIAGVLKYRRILEFNSVSPSPALRTPTKAA
ncbi:MAG: hypothetical protein ACLUNQ_07795 [Oscillospiraceae bacterium]